jgi:hypothetical protein
LVSVGTYAVDAWLDPQKEFKVETAVAKGVGGFVQGSLAVIPGPVGGAASGAAGHAAEKAVENLFKYGGDISRIGEGITTESLIQEAATGVVSKGVSHLAIGGLERLPGYLKPVAGQPLGQLSLFSNTYGATAREVAKYKFARFFTESLVDNGISELWGPFDGLELEDDLRHGLVKPAYAPTYAPSGDK